MTWPSPRPGLVIRYAYLWEREARVGMEEGAKDRPCAVLLTLMRDDDVEPLIWVLPVTHTPPSDLSSAVEIPAVTKQRLRLDSQRSWVMLNEANEFRWPGPDLRPSVCGNASSAVYGMLPPRFYAHLKARWLERYQAGKALRVRRTE